MTSRISILTRLMYSLQIFLVSAQEFNSLVGWQGVPPWEAAQPLHRQERENQDHREADKSWVWGSSPRGRHRRIDKDQDDVDVPQEAGRAEEDLKQQRGRFRQLQLGQPQQPQKLSRQRRPEHQIQRRQMIPNNLVVWRSWNIHVHICMSECDQIG